jgi:hypothetical protein
MSAKYAPASDTQGMSVGARPHRCLPTDPGCVGASRGGRPRSWPLSAEKLGREQTVRASALMGGAGLRYYCLHCGRRRS